MIDVQTKTCVQAMENAGYTISINFDKDGLATGILTQFPDSFGPVDEQACVPFLTAYPTARQQSRAMFEFLTLRNLH